MLPLTAEQLQMWIADRMQAAQAVESVSIPSLAVHSDLPATVEQWMAFVLQARLPKIRKGKAVGRDSIPNELYQAAGESVQLLLSHLLCRV